MGALDGKVAIVTGAGRGIGRGEAVGLAAEGATVIVNDLGGSWDGAGQDQQPAQQVVDEIVAAGGTAVTNYDDIADWDGGRRLIQQAIDTYGRLDILVCNAGIARDRTVFNMTESEWDDVIRVHLKGHAAVSRAAAVHWRAASKAAGGPVYGRVINTTSEAFLFGSPGQPNYSAAKAGITALTLATAQGLSRYGVRTNAICPRARTGMTADAFGAAETTDGELDALAPERVGTFVSYLASSASDEINGQVFVVYGDMVALLAPPTVEEKFTAKDGTFTPEELESQLTSYFAGRDPYKTYAAYSIAALDTTGTQNATAPR